MDCWSLDRDKNDKIIIVSVLPSGQCLGVRAMYKKTFKKIYI